MIIGQSSCIAEINSIIERIAPTDLSVLITGESGVGKEIVAQEIWHKSQRKDQPWVKINSAAIPGDLVESQLFGYQRGAFTGADQSQAGWVQSAHRGTLFFDEIGELSRSSQAKLLQIMQDKTFTPVGSNREVPVDIRVLSATNRDLLEAVDKGEFRDDLYHRLDIVQIRVPPLRSRREDIPLFLDYFFEKYKKQYQKGMQGLDLTKSAEDFLKVYEWPGNVRELENFVKNVVLFEEVGAPLAKLQDQANGMRSNGEPRSLIELSREVEARVEKRLISSALKKNGWNRKKTAETLNISYRSLLDKIKRFGIH